MPTDSILSARVFLPKALSQETEYSSQHKKSHLNAGQTERTSIYQSCCLFAFLFLKRHLNKAKYSIYRNRLPVFGTEGSGLEPIHFQLQRKPLYLVIYSSLLDLPSHLHGQFAIWDNEKNMTISSFFIFIPKWQTFRADVTTSLKSLNKLPSTSAFSAAENWMPATLKTVESFS